MKYSKLIGIFLLICVAITFLGVASATEIVVSGEKFNIPDGFNKDETGCYVAKTAITSEESVLYDNMDKGEFISIFITSSSGFDMVPPDGPEYEEKTIAGIDGKYSEDETGVSFFYTNDGKLISISLSNDCSATFEDIIVNTTSEESSSLFDWFN